VTDYLWKAVRKTEQERNGRVQYLDVYFSLKAKRAYFPAIKGDYFYRFLYSWCLVDTTITNLEENE
jgi:hypothetical protein